MTSEDIMPSEILSYQAIPRSVTVAQLLRRSPSWTCRPRLLSSTLDDDSAVYPLKAKTCKKDVATSGGTTRGPKKHTRVTKRPRTLPPPYRGVLGVSGVVTLEFE